MSKPKKSEVREILEWELSLDSRDLRAHAWYHGNLTRLKAEELLETDGDFLVRDCTSSGRPGDFVLTCKWKNNHLHFLVHKDIQQPDTIYEKLTYRFENDQFDTVPDLIRYHVGSGIPISIASGVLINSPRNRIEPIYKGEILNENSNLIYDGTKSDYVSLMKASAQPIPKFTFVEKASTLERLKQKSLNLTPPAGLLEELEDIPLKIKELILKQTSKGECGSSFDLGTFDSIMFPSSKSSIKLDQSILDVVNNRLLESSDKLVALHLTKLDWDILNGLSPSISDYEDDNFDENELSFSSKDNDKNKEQEQPSSSIFTNMYELLLHNSSHRWNNVIERSFSLSHFVILTILKSPSPEKLVSKWISISNELKSSYGNFFSFCSIMRGLLMPEITRSDGKINWMKLRQDFTCTTFMFETSLRAAFSGFVKGTESYPPNTTVPELLSIGLILEDSLELLPLSCVNQTNAGSYMDGGGGTNTTIFQGQLEQVYTLSKSSSTWSSLHQRNIERQLQDSALMIGDPILTDIFRTEFQLLLIWGEEEYKETNLQFRSENLCSRILQICKYNNPI